MKRFIVGAVAVVAAFATSTAPAYATHDTTCAPGVPGPPLCVSGHMHLLDDAYGTFEDTRAVVREAVYAAAATAEQAAQRGGLALNAIADPMCLGQTGVCVSGARQQAQYYYSDLTTGAFRTTFFALCLALQSPAECLS